MSGTPKKEMTPIDTTALVAQLQKLSDDAKAQADKMVKRLGYDENVEMMRVEQRAYAHAAKMVSEAILTRLTAAPAVPRCGTCKHFKDHGDYHAAYGRYAVCNGLPAMNPPWVPPDGSGYCHHHAPLHPDAPKETT